MKYYVSKIEFDFTDATDEQLSAEEKNSITQNNIGVWDADDDDDLIEEITTASGWCINSIDYEIQLK
tara:strand:+ start:152 stop:352 length:201 start_codon:yes stop_codon:yes gene_type:complete